MTDHEAEAWHRTVQHLEAAGFPAIVWLEYQRQLWRRGGRDRELAERLRRRCGDR